MKPLKILVSLLLALAIFSCNTREKDSEKFAKDSWLLSMLLILTPPKYPNLCPPFTLLNPGDKTISLSQGQEYWFDISPRIGNANPNVYYDIVLRKSPGQTVDLGRTNCYADSNGGVPHSYSTSSDSKQTITQIGDTITYHVAVGNTDFAGQALLILTSTVGSGNITITVPSVGTAN